MKNMGIVIGGELVDTEIEKISLSFTRDVNTSPITSVELYAVRSILI